MAYHNFTFDEQTDKLRADLRKRIAELWQNPLLSQQSKLRIEGVLNEQINRLEIARRIHNHFVLTGEVVIPD